MIREQTRGANKKHSRAAAAPAVVGTKSTSLPSALCVFVRREFVFFSARVFLLHAAGPENGAKMSISGARVAARTARSHKSVINSKAQKQRKRPTELHHQHQAAGEFFLFISINDPFSLFQKHTPSLSLYSGRGGLRPVDSPPLNWSAQIAWFFYVNCLKGRACRQIKFPQVVFEHNWARKKHFSIG
jgi:hypothetical protein